MSQFANYTAVTFDAQRGLWFWELRSYRHIVLQSASYLTEQEALSHQY